MTFSNNPNGKRKSNLNNIMHHCTSGDLS